MSLVVYRLAQSLSYKPSIDNLYYCRKFVIRKYMLIVYKIFSSQEGLFGRYIHARIGYIFVDKPIMMMFLIFTNVDSFIHRYYSYTTYIIIYSRAIRYVFYSTFNF